jgi:O-antigen/teichoic acid export membrane protein
MIQTENGNMLRIGGRFLARNTALNFIGQAVPLLVGVATIPYVIRGLDTERFGVLSIAWVLLGYLGVFDLGLGRATTKFVAECLGRGEIGRLPGWIWSSLAFQILFGIGGAALVGALTPFVVERVLKIPPSLLGETKTTFFILAASLPVVLAANAVRGVLEAAQRFDLVNYVKVPCNVSVFLIPAIAVPFGIRLPGIVSLLVLARLSAGTVYLVLCCRVFPVLRGSLSFNSKLLRPLAAYGGWVTVANVVGSFLVYSDRFMIGTLLSVAAVTYYTAPYEAIARLSIISSSLAATLFPAFTSIGASVENRMGLGKVYARSVKWLLLTMGPLMALVVAFAAPILRLWLGADFARQSTLVLQILAVGVLINSLAFVPFSLLQALNRPDVTAKFYLVEFPLYGVLLWVLISHLGIAGAALAWTLRGAVDAGLLFGACRRLQFVSPSVLGENGLWRSIAGVCAFAVPLLLTRLTGATLLTQAALAVLLVLLFGVGAWSFVLDIGDRKFLTSAAGQVVARFQEGS